MNTKECLRCLLPEGIVSFTITRTQKKRSICDECRSAFGNYRTKERRKAMNTSRCKPVRIYHEGRFTVKVLPPDEAEGARLSVDMPWARYGVTRMFVGGGVLNDDQFNLDGH